jgi:hypothetical protein
LSLTFRVLHDPGGHDHAEPDDDHRPIAAHADDPSGRRAFVDLPGEGVGQHRRFLVPQPPMRAAPDRGQVEREPNQGLDLRRRDRHSAGDRRRIRDELGALEGIRRVERREVGNREDRSYEPGGRRRIR